MKTLSEEDKKKIIEEFAKRGVKYHCPMCGNNNFVVADGYFNNTIQPELKGFILGGPSIPTIPIICTNCGYISQHALGVLNLLPGGTDESKK